MYPTPPFVPLSKAARAWAGVLLLSPLFALGLSSATARADTIDDELVKEAPRIMAYLHKNALRNVGVLRFRVKKGTELPTFTAGPINTNMVTRLENLIALAADDKSPIHLLYEPGRTIASKKSRLSYLHAEGRGELLKLKFDAVGLSKPVHADAFLMGDVILNEDYSKTTVIIRAFRQARLMPEEVTRFSVDTDRSVLADIGENFIITKRNWKKGSSRDLAARSSLKQNGGDPGADTDPVVTKPKATDLTHYVQFKVLYDKEEQSIGQDAKKNKWQVANPRKNQEVIIKIKNVHDKKLGVVLTMNGESTIFNEEGAMSDLGKWVLDPGEEYEIKGFYLKDRTYAPFAVVSPDEAQEMMSGKPLGQIQYAVFDQEPEKDMKIGLRGVTTPDLRKRPASRKELTQNLNKRLGLKRGDDGAIVPAPEAKPAPDLKIVPFPNASMVGVRTIYYFQPAEPKKGDPKSKDTDDSDS